MRRVTRRLAVTIGILIVLSCGAYALSTGDSLISLSYLKDTFFPAAVQQGETAANGKLQRAYDEAKGTLDTLQQGYLGQESGTSGSYSAVFQPNNWKAGDTVELSSGSGDWDKEADGASWPDGAEVSWPS